MNIVGVNNLSSNLTYHSSFTGKVSPQALVDKFMLRNPESATGVSEFRELKNIYNELWKKLSLPEQLKPRIQLKAMLSTMAFSTDDYMIYVQKSFKPFVMNIRNKTGINESVLRHEIEHVMQFWKIISLIGAENLKNEIIENPRHLDINMTPALFKKMKDIEKTFGRISPDSPEYKEAQKIYEGFKSYPNMSTFLGIFGFKDFKTMLQYQKNILEIQAREKEEIYKPSIGTIIKTNIKEFWNLFTNK